MLKGPKVFRSPDLVVLPMLGLEWKSVFPDEAGFTEDVVVATVDYDILTFYCTIDLFDLIGLPLERRWAEDQTLSPIIMQNF
jgi:hypothetical protein